MLKKKKKVVCLLYASLAGGGRTSRQLETVLALPVQGLRTLTGSWGSGSQQWLAAGSFWPSQ